MMNFSEEKTITSNTITISNFLPQIGLEDIRKEILTGLQADQKYISSKFFYDEKGSSLFEEITKLEEYYPTRTEKSILKNIDSSVFKEYSNKSIIELGSGDCSKISLFLSRIAEAKLENITYYPVDVSQSAIEESVKCLLKQYPMLKVNGLVADFMHQLDFLPEGGERIFCFFGSTLGNFTREQSIQFLQSLYNFMRVGDELFLGLDMVKDIHILEAAYNDNKEVTAAFNLNILNAVNQLIESDINIDDFEHIAFYNKDKERIEMHLKALNDMEIKSPFSDQTIGLKKEEMIHTENSHKFSKTYINHLAEKTELEVSNIFTDEKGWFSLVHLLKK
jgi:L-histidine N-alpha-methyltransferase